MPTFNRRKFLPQAVKNFVNQTYENKELIIVDDGPTPVIDCIPKDSRLTYVSLSHRESLGHKLNLGIERSHGKIIQKMDDDDFYHPRFLSTTVAALHGNNPETSVAGFHCFLVLIAQTGEVRFSGEGWCAGGTLCFFRELWEKTPFRDISGAEDWHFLRDSRAQQIKVNDAELYILVRHGGGHAWNSMGHADVTDTFRQRPPYHKPLEALVCSEDLEFYRSLQTK